MNKIICKKCKNKKFLVSKGHIINMIRLTCSKCGWELYLGDN